MKSLLRRVALACIVASVLPQVAAVADALHVLFDHGTEHGHALPADSMMAALHGHAHSAETPDHDHPLTVPVAGGASHARAPLQPALPMGCGGPCAAFVTAADLTVGDRPTIPPPTQVIWTVLRI